MIAIRDCRRLLFAALGAAAVLAACKDTPWQTGAKISLTPDIIVLSPIAAAGTASSTTAGPTSQTPSSPTAADKTLPTQQTVTIYGTGSDSKPAEGIHVDISVGSSTGGATGTEFVQISPVAVTSGVQACTQVSSWQLACILGVDGSASFVVNSTSAVDSNTALSISASSPPSVATAIVFVGRPLANGATLTIPPIAPPTLVQSNAVVCSEAQVPTCSSLVRASAASVQVSATAGSSGAAQEGPQPLVGTVVDVDVTIQAKPGTLSGSAWLSAKSDCSSPQTNLPTQTTAATGSASFFVCMDGQPGDYQISAIAGSLDQPVTTGMPTEVTVDAVPARISALLRSCSTGGDAGPDAGSTGNVLVSAYDCNNKLISPPNVSWGLGSSTTTTLTFGPNGDACISVPTSTDGDSGLPIVSLSFSSCVGPLNLMGNQ